MIKTEYYMTRPDGVNLYKTYSDAGFMIRQMQTGAVYDAAIDIENSGYTYTETDEPIPSEELSDAQALDILMGGSGDEQT